MAKRKTMKHLGAWQKFVMKVRSENPDKSFKDVLKLAGQMKRKGVDIEKYVSGSSAPAKAPKKKGKTMKRKTGKRKTGKRKH